MKIVSVFLKYDYGLQSRGESLEKHNFLPALSQVVDEVIPFWIEDNGYPQDLTGLQRNILGFIECEKPDVIFFVLMDNEISSDTIEKLSKKYITMNWFCDDPWRFENFTQYLAPLFRYSITVDKYSISKYRKIGCKNVIHSQWAAFEYVNNINFNSIKYTYDISFIGGKNSTREWIIHELNKAGYRVECYGADWGNGRISYEEIKKVFLHSKINLNLSNSMPYDIRFHKFVQKPVGELLKTFKIKSPVKSLRNIADDLSVSEPTWHNSKKIESLKARYFEIPGCGGFQLGQYALEIEDYYDIGKEIAVFGAIDELKRQLDYYLEHDEEREIIKEKGYNRTKHYTYENRFRDIFAIIQQEKN